jgi:TetR/AcrR family transcriptional repressor of lmrAB and yxaGH operons
VASTRDRMVYAAAGLFRDRGYDGTGFRDVVEAAGTTPGVIYHHFPGGKAELGVAVAGAVGDRIAALVEGLCAEHAPRVAIEGLLRIVEQNMVNGDLRPGCPIVAISLAAEDPDGALRAASDSFFTRTRAAVEKCLVRDGVGRRDARSFAALAVAACEGAVIMCRAGQGVEPLRTSRQALLDQLDRLPRTEPS